MVTAFLLQAILIGGPNNLLKLTLSVYKPFEVLAVL